MSKVTVQILINNELVDVIRDQEKPQVGEYLEIPKGIYEGLQVYVDRVLNKYPKPGAINQETIVQCECLPT